MGATVDLVVPNRLNYNGIDVNIHRIKERSQQQIVQKVEDLINRMKEKELDIFGFEARIYRHNHAVWRMIRDDWERLFRESEVSVTVSFDIKDVGLIVNY